MTPVGLTLIVGGITTLIVFRAALFGTGRDEKTGERAGNRATPDDSGVAGQVLRAGAPELTAAPGERRPRREATSVVRSSAAPVRKASRDGEAGPAERKATRAAERKAARAGEATGSRRKARAAGRTRVPAAESEVAAGARVPARTWTRAGRPETGTAGGSAPVEQPARGAVPGASGEHRQYPAVEVPMVRAAHPQPPVARPAPPLLPPGRPVGSAVPPDVVGGRVGPPLLLPAGSAVPPVQAGPPMLRPGRPDGPDASDTRTGVGSGAFGPDSRGSRTGTRHGAGPGSRGRWPVAGGPGDEEQRPRPDQSLLHLLDDPDRAAGPATGPAEAGLLSLGLTDGLDDPDPGVPADRGGDPELDIDQDLDRAADPYRTDEEAPELSGSFEAVTGTGAFPELYDEVSLRDPDETGHHAAPAGPQHADPHDGDRVEGWIRPEYPDPGPAAGEYWTPAPSGSYETGYGWPVPVERLPAAPPYPSSELDVPPELAAEPTAAVLQWPPSHPDDRVGPPREPSGADSADELPGRRRFDEAATEPDEQTAAPVSRRALDRAGLRRRRPPEDGPAPGDDRPAAATGPAGEETGGFRRQGPVTDDFRGLRRLGPRAAGGRRQALDDDGADLPPLWPPLPDDGAAALDPLPRRIRTGEAARNPATADADREAQLEPPDSAEAPEQPGWVPEEGTGDRRSRRQSTARRRRAAPGNGEDATQALPTVDVDQLRSRPRPRPRPGGGPAEGRSTVYVSRHAADPS